MIGNAHRRCAAGDGGKLKICGLDPQLAEIFSIVGMAGQVDLHADEAAAIESPWPARATPRQLPVDISERTAGDRRRSATCRVDRRATRPRLPVVLWPGLEEPPGIRDPACTGHVRSRGQPAGADRASDSRTVNVATPRFLIGRDRGCQLRLGSAQVSKQHAALEQRDGRVYLRDLGSTNGTFSTAGISAISRSTCTTAINSRSVRCS